MYPTSVSGAAVGLGGGALAATGLVVSGYIWAAVVLMAIGTLLVALGAMRDRRLASVRAGADRASGPRPS